MERLSVTPRKELIISFAIVITIIISSCKGVDVFQTKSIKHAFKLTKKKTSTNEPTV